MVLVRKYFLHGLINSILIGGLFAFLGIYNTNAMPFFNSFVFWVSTMLVGNLSTGLLLPLVINRWLAKHSLLVQLSCIVILMSIPVTFVLAAFDHNYGVDWSIQFWLLQYRYVIVISAILIFVGYFVVGTQIARDLNAGYANSLTNNVSCDANKAKASGELELQFLKRLTLKHHQARLLAIKSEDHYLRVYTSVGEELILMRLSDAIESLAGSDGMQTHRSWWVARHTIWDVQRKQGKLYLYTEGDLAVPVSRTYEKPVKELLAT